MTIGRRAETGHWPGKMLQVSATGLAASFIIQASDSSALVGTNKPYAAMMQFGDNQADFPQLWGDIPGRPYLPMDAEGNPQPEAEKAILDLALDHLKSATEIVR